MTERHVFGREHVPLVTAAQALAHDRYAREKLAIPERVLMENAGRAVALITERLYPRGLVVGMLGSGHNGGDALVALRTLQNWGRDVAFLRTGRAADAALTHGFDIPELAAEDATEQLAHTSVVLDGVLGTGAQGAPRPDVAHWLRTLSAAARPIIALDVPSGIDATTGEVADCAVRADITVTFGFVKAGLVRQPARTYCGRLIAVEIGFPPLTSKQTTGALITPQWAAARLPPRKPNAHKGSSGRLLLLAGSYGMGGAAIICAQAALRSGAGLVQLVSASDNRELLQSAVPEATFFDRAAHIDTSGVTALAAGPGIGTNDESRTALDRLLAATNGIPTLLDADALNLLAGDRASLRTLARNRPLLITPHPKELSRISGCNVAEITADPLAHAQRFADESGAVVLLKGQPSIVAQTGQRLLVNSVGSSDFATAGMGDQLSGVVGALLAAGLAPREAAAVGLFYSGRAGDLAGRGRALTPRDVTDHMVRAFAFPGPPQSSLELPFITFDQPARW